MLVFFLSSRLRRRGRLEDVNVDVLMDAGLDNRDSSPAQQQFRKFAAGRSNLSLREDSSGGLGNGWLLLGRISFFTFSLLRSSLRALVFIMDSYGQGEQARGSKGDVDIAGRNIRLARWLHY